MSSPYQILENRPLDQWKVTELKEELKRRKLTIRGLKEDLVKRLDEAVRIERENAQNDADNGVKFSTEPELVVKDVETQAVLSENVGGIEDDGVKGTGKVDNLPVQVDTYNSAAAVDQGNIQEGYVLVGKDLKVEEETVVVHETPVETGFTVTESEVSEVTGREHNFLITQTQEENGNSKSQLENDDSKAQLDGEDPKPQVESDDSKPTTDDSKAQLEIDNLKPQLETEYSKPSSEEAMLGVSSPQNQVSEVSPNLGSPVKYDSISTDSVSINEKIELKDNIIADNVKLELDFIKPEMVAPSSSTVVPVGGDSHLMDVEEPHESKTSVEEKDDISDTNADLGKKNDIVDVGYSEKLNLDRSSGDDSMEEDVLESKQVDSKYSSYEVGDKSEKTGVFDVKEEDHVDVMGDDFSADKKDVHIENKDRPSAPAEKRKLDDQSLVGNNEPLKRQRRWNTENLKVPEPQSNLTPTPTPKDTFQSPVSKRFTRVDSTASDDAPKERVVPPSPKPPTNSLRIDRFLRPFTLKAVQELLGKTGNVTSFWMDHIKTHCYVTYSSVEEAIETRNAVYNLQWPPNGGRLLLAEFVNPQEVKNRVEAPQALAAPANAAPIVPPTPPASQPQQSPRPRQQVAVSPSLPPPPPLSSPPQARERLPLPPPPPLPEKHDPPIVTLDDLFRKTKATPRIYYLPLSEEQVATKLAAQGKNT